MKSELDSVATRAMAKEEAASYESDWPANMVELVAMAVGVAVIGLMLKGLLGEMLDHLMRNIH